MIRALINRIVSVLLALSCVVGCKHAVFDSTSLVEPEDPSVAGEIYMINADGKNLVNLTNHPAFDGGASWSPDGSRIVFSRWINKEYFYSDIYVMTAYGTHQRKLTNSSVRDNGPRWSPDGSNILFNSYNPRVVPSIKAIHVMNADGTNRRRLTEGSISSLNGIWSPDGRSILYRREPAGAPRQYYIMTENGTHHRSLTSDSLRAGFGQAWSPDGTQVVLSAFGSSGMWGLYVVNVDGSGARPLLFHPTFIFDPSWSPDGKEILFFAGDEVRDVYVVDVNGTNPRSLTAGFANASGAQWFPDGSRILFTTRDLKGNLLEGYMYAISRTGTGLEKLSRNSTYFVTLGPVPWSPDGNRLLYSVGHVFL